jgi:hypothetical protein
MRSRGARLKGANLESEAQVAPSYGGLAEVIIGRAFARPVGLAALRSTIDAISPPPSRSGFRRAARRSAAGPSWFRCAGRSSHCRRRALRHRADSLRRVTQLPDGQIRSPYDYLLSSLPFKNIPFRAYPKSTLELPPSRSTERRFAIVTDAERDAVDARRRERRMRVPRGRRSRVVLMPRRWHQVSRINPRGDGGKQARSPGRARRKPLKPLRGECRVNPV